MGPSIMDIFNNTQEKTKPKTIPVLSWHMQSFVEICWSGTALQEKEIATEFKLWVENHLYN